MTRSRKGRKPNKNDRLEKARKMQLERSALLALHAPPEAPPEGIDIEYIVELPEIQGFEKAFERLGVSHMNTTGELEDPIENPKATHPSLKDHEIEIVDGLVVSPNAVSKIKKHSNKEVRIAHRIPIHILKSRVSRPDLVDSWDNTSSDPLFLLHLKSIPNTVPIPSHWNAKRKYMHSKRGSDRPPYELPEYIEQTGITKIRQGILKKEAEKTNKNRSRAKTRPAAGKMDIDFHVLHDAFFKFSKKMTHLAPFGDLYYEGKECQVKMISKKPGKFSPALKAALAMEDGGPPPWLINMQRFGPPQSYPGLKIPGVNSPIPKGSSYGYMPGEWGRPPVDDKGRPIYGTWNVERDRADLPDSKYQDEKDFLWGEPREESSSESEDDDEVDIDMNATGIEGGTSTPLLRGGISTPLHFGTQTPLLNLGRGLDSGIASLTGGISSITGGITSLTGGIGTPGSLELKGISSVTGVRKTLLANASNFRVLPQVQVPTQPSALFPTNYKYVLPVGGISSVMRPGLSTPESYAPKAEEIRKQLEEHRRKEQEVLQNSGYVSTNSSSAVSGSVSTSGITPSIADSVYSGTPNVEKKKKKIKF